MILITETDDAYVIESEYKVRAFFPRDERFPQGHEMYQRCRKEDLASTVQRIIEESEDYQLQKLIITRVPDQQVLDLYEAAAKLAGSAVKSVQMVDDALLGQWEGRPAACSGCLENGGSVLSGHFLCVGQSLEALALWRAGLIGPALVTDSSGERWEWRA